MCTSKIPTEKRHTVANDKIYKCVHDVDIQLAGQQVIYDTYNEMHFILQELQRANYLIRSVRAQNVFCVPDCL
jgi:hypothetical protein